MVRSYISVEKTCARWFCTHFVVTFSLASGDCKRLWASSAHRDTGGYRCSDVFMGNNEINTQVVSNERARCDLKSYREMKERWTCIPDSCDTK